MRIMKISVKLFASLGRYAPSGASAKPFDVAIEEDATLQRLMDQLGIPQGEVRLMFVNGRAKTPEEALRPGDEVGFFPPIGGG